MSLEELPNHVIVEEILAILYLPDLMRFSQVSKRFNLLCERKECWKVVRFNNTMLPENIEAKLLWYLPNTLVTPFVKSRSLDEYRFITKLAIFSIESYTLQCLSNLLELSVTKIERSLGFVLWKCNVRVLCISEWDSSFQTLFHKLEVLTFPKDVQLEWDVRFHCTVLKEIHTWWYCSEFSEDSSQHCKIIRHGKLWKYLQMERLPSIRDAFQRYRCANPEKDETMQELTEFFTTEEEICFGDTTPLIWLCENSPDRYHSYNELIYFFLDEVKVPSNQHITCDPHKKWRKPPFSPFQWCTLESDSDPSKGALYCHLSSPNAVNPSLVQRLMKYVKESDHRDLLDAVFRLYLPPRKTDTDIILNKIRVLLISLLKDPLFDPNREIRIERSIEYLFERCCKENVMVWPMLAHGADPMQYVHVFPLYYLMESKLRHFPENGGEDCEDIT